MTFDEEYLDPHGECANEISRLKEINAELLAALKLWEAYDNCDEADFSQSGPMLLYAEAIEATRAAISRATVTP